MAARKPSSGLVWALFAISGVSGIVWILAAFGIVTGEGSTNTLYLALGVINLVASLVWLVNAVRTAKADESDT